MFTAGQFRAHVGKLGLELHEPPCRVLVSRLSGAEFRPPVDMLPMQPIDLRLATLAAVFVLTDPLSGIFQASVEVFHLALERTDLSPDVTQDFLALDDSGTRISIARHA